jgi:hypothetical protein
LNSPHVVACGFNGGYRGAVLDTYLQSAPPAFTPTGVDASRGCRLPAGSS